MADKPTKPVLPRPPGYRDPGHPVKSAPRPLPSKTLVPPSLQPRKRRSRHYCRLCLCCSILLFIIVILLLVISGGLFYIWFDPKLPVFHLQSFKFPTFRVTKKSDGTYLTAKMVARLEVRNPNEKIVYHFGESEVGTTTGDEEVNLGSTSLPKFTQEKGNATSLKTVTSVKSELVEDRIGSAILNQFTKKKLKAKMKVKTRVGISVAGMKTGLLGVEVLCGGVTLKETESGEMPRCVMKILKCIKFSWNLGNDDEHFRVMTLWSMLHQERSKCQVIKLDILRLPVRSGCSHVAKLQGYVYLIAKELAPCPYPQDHHPLTSYCG